MITRRQMHGWHGLFLLLSVVAGGWAAPRVAAQGDVPAALLNPGPRGTVGSTRADIAAVYGASNQLLPALTGSRYEIDGYLMEDVQVALTLGPDQRPRPQDRAFEVNVMPYEDPAGWLEDREYALARRLLPPDAHPLDQLQRRETKTDIMYVQSFKSDQLARTLPDPAYYAAEVGTVWIEVFVLNGPEPRALGLTVSTCPQEAGQTCQIYASQ